MNNIAILITCFNRKQITLRCLERLHSLKNNNIDVYVVDDGSTDGTSEAISTAFPNVNIIKGSGNLFWNRGMHLAWSHAEKKNYAFFIWLNDDVILYENSLPEVIECSKIYNDQAIISGIIETHDKTNIIYGGTDKNKILIKPNGEPQKIINMNGNFVLVPSSVFKKLGNLDPVYHHDLGDVDYGFRAEKFNIGVYSTRISIGSGDSNNICRVRLNNSNIINRFKRLYSPLGNNPNINFYFRINHNSLINAIMYYIFLHVLNMLPDKFVWIVFKEKYK